jgi:hypothetical protein
MSNLISVPSTLTSPPFDLASDRRLAISVIPRGDLTANDHDQMYELLADYFIGTSRSRFEADLTEKESVFLLRDDFRGRIRGFSTLMRLDALIDGQDVVAFFSGDTIVAQTHWGENALGPLWAQTVFAEADRIRANRPEARIYWYLICSGYRTWRFLPVFFREYFPNPTSAMPPEMLRIRDVLGERKFGKQYLHDYGIVRFRSASPLRCGVADITEERLRDPRIAFFHRMNPGHAQGDELACLTEISRSNLTRAGERMLSIRQHQDRSI